MWNPKQELIKKSIKIAKEKHPEAFADIEKMETDKAYAKKVEFPNFISLGLNDNISSTLVKSFNKCKSDLGDEKKKKIHNDLMKANL